MRRKQHATPTRPTPSASEMPHPAHSDAPDAFAGIEYAAVMRSALNNLEAVVEQYRAAGYAISARISNGRIYSVGAAECRPAQ